MQRLYRHACNRFCSSCNRIRLTSKGELKGCLCYEKQEDLSDILSNTQISMEEKEKVILERLRKVIYENNVARDRSTNELIEFMQRNPSQLKLGKDKAYFYDLL